MNDEPLKRELLKLEVPPADIADREKAWHRARIALLNSSASAAPAMSVARPAARGRIAFALACAILAFGWFALPSSPPRSPDAKLLSETEALFPGQLDAVICVGEEVRLDLSEQPGPRPTQPVAVTLRRGKETVRALAYSGRRFRVNLGQKEESFEPLVTGDGKVILEGNHFVWSEQNPQSIAGFRVEARALAL